MLTAVLSCRENMSNSGIVARIAGDNIGAVRHMPNMATEEFLSCLSKAGVEKAAAAEGVRIGARAKDTRAALIERFANGAYVYPTALFRPTEQEIADAKAAASWRYVPGSTDEGDADAGADAENLGSTETEEDAGWGKGANDGDADTQAIAAE